MARNRVYGEDLTYDSWHRQYLPHLYGRIGHRLDCADRDQTEHCHYCRDPVCIYELVRNKGQNLLDKATTMTRKMAARSAVPAFLVAWSVDRPANVQQEIDRLNNRLRVLEAAHQITGFTVRKLWPQLGALTPQTADQWAETLLLMHRNHHATCRPARMQEIPVVASRIRAAKKRNPLWTPSDDQPLLDLEVH